MRMVGHGMEAREKQSDESIHLCLGNSSGETIRRIYRLIL